ncbi:hypothetical protein [Maridesulfovibrio zosterae]|uniref:hypothetical protein n=1 Tax=Maridesulfovibrio zosterae TaxID=82171 RepID=UPI0003F83D4D|nr:hypothetical protein [Maridesulfovibrio zosterae]
MNLLFVHGWSVTDQETYGDLPEAVVTAATADGLDINVQHIFLGKYISFHDEVTLDDIARAFDVARKDAMKKVSADENAPFACITHSTGGPVIRLWAHLFYGLKNKMSETPLKHLVMLAPANHGSALAQLGKSKLGRLKAIFSGVEPGTGVLNWLELGSAQQWDLNTAWLNYNFAANGLYSFVLSGQTIDEKIYDFVNSYLVEKGSDGVVRLAGANMNYGYVRLRQNVNNIIGDTGRSFFHEAKSITKLEVVGGSFVNSPKTPFCVVKDASHSGETIGIMRSVTESNYADKPVVGNILKCLKVTDLTAYDTVDDNFKAISKQVQDADTKVKDQYSMLVFRVTDDRGNPVNDFDMLLLAGDDFNPDGLPKGFHEDHQKNIISPNILTYYVNYSELKRVPDGKIGIRIAARPDEGFSHYSIAEFRSTGFAFDDILKPNQTLLVDVELTRHVDENTFGLTPLADGKHNFKKEKTSGKDVPPTD